jgi:hypothetical protein
MLRLGIENCECFRRFFGITQDLPWKLLRIAGLRLMIFFVKKADDFRLFPKSWRLLWPGTVYWEILAAAELIGW